MAGCVLGTRAGACSLNISRPTTGPKLLSATGRRNTVSERQSVSVIRDDYSRPPAKIRGTIGFAIRGSIIWLKVFMTSARWLLY